VSAAASHAVAASGGGAGAAARRFLAQGGFIILLLAATVAIMAVIQPRFFYRLNLLNILRNFTHLSIISLGQMLVMIAGGFDLSVGVVVALSSVVAASIMASMGDAMPATLVILVGCAGALASGAAVGLGNGLCVAVLRVNPLIVTLAMSSIVVGGTLYYTQGIPIYGIPDGFMAVLGRGFLLGLPVTAYIALALILLIVLAQRATAAGRHVYAVGGNPQAARLAGIAVPWVTTAVYVVSGLFAAVTGLLLTGLVGSGQSSIGSTATIQSISAAVIGGVSLRGGVGRAERVVLAALFLTVLANALDLGRVDSKWQTLVLGAVLIIALSVERLLSRRTADG
jgi:ribose transport system permease protein